MNLETHKKWMRKTIALAIAKMQQGHGGPFGALIVKKGKIIAMGYNQVTSTNDPTAHAEIQAIRTACKKLRSFQLTNCDVYTSSEPCPMCLGALYWARPSRIFIGCSRKEAAKAGFDDAFIYRELKLTMQKRSIPQKVILTSEARKAFKKWEKKSDKILY